jgi:hypothetical protein
VDRDVPIAISETKYRAGTARSTWLFADEVVGKIMRRAQL